MGVEVAGFDMVEAPVEIVIGGDNCGLDEKAYIEVEKRTQARLKIIDALKAKIVSLRL